MRVILLLSSAFLASSCASYQWGEKGRQIPGGYQTISVPIFKNDTHETGAETYFTNAMIEEVSRSRLGRLQVKDHAAVVLEGVIHKIEYRPESTVTAGNLAFPLPNKTVLNVAYRVYATVGIVLRRTSDQKIIKSFQVALDRPYQGSKIGTEYLNSANALYNQSTRMQNLQLIAADLMAQAYDQMTENF